MNRKLTALIAIIAGLAAVNAYAQVQSPTTITPISLTTANYVTFYTQNFDTLTNSPIGGSSTTLPAGWGFTESGTSSNTTYGIDAGASATGNTYSYGATTATDRAFGGLQSGAVIPTVGAVFTNNTGNVLSTLTVTYTGEEWRLGTSARLDRLDFQINTAATTGSNALLTGTWTDVDSLDFNTPNTTTLAAHDGNLAANRTTITFAITGLSIADGTSFAFRWVDFNASGSDDGLAIDDFTLAIPEPSTIAGALLALSALVYHQRRRFCRTAPAPPKPVAA